jgi:hypothetical protein
MHVDRPAGAPLADHNSLFSCSGWASYDTARVGTLRLSPHANRIPDVRADYRKMAPIMFDDPTPSFDDIIKRIAVLEKTINGG